MNRRPTEWRNEIERVVNKSPGDLGDDQNLLQYVLKEKMHVAFFTKAAESLDWLDWIDDQGYLDGMFDERSRHEKNGLWARWLVEKFAVSHADDLKYVIGRREGRLPVYFWVPLAKAVQSNDLDDQDFDQWATLLISRVPKEIDSYPLYQLCKFCAERGLMSISAHIFDLMLTMRPIIKNDMKDMQSSDLEYTPDLDFNRLKLQPEYDLGFQHEMVSWRETISRFDHLAELLIDPVIRRLEERHRILSAWKKSHRQHDSALTGYTLIESGNMSNDAGINLMICVARDCLDWIVENRSENRAYWRRRLANSESPVLRCLAAHSVRKDADLSPDKKAAWLLETNSLLELKRLNDCAPYRELYRLAEEIYPELDDERRGSLIEAVGEYRFSMPDGELNAEIDERHQYDWYRVLHRSDSECSLAKAAFEAAQNKHPEWKPSPDVGIRAIQGSPSSLNPEQLLARQGFEWVPELPVLFNHVSQNPRINDSVRGLSEAVRKAAMQNFDWGLALADGLADANEWETEVWSSLLQAWSHGENRGRTDMDKSQYRKVLNLIENENLHGKQERDSFIIRTLNSLVANDGAPYAFELLSETNRIANLLWDKIDEHNAVHLARYWLNVLSLLRRYPDSIPEELEQDWAEASSKIMRDQSPKGRACLSALAERFSCLLDLDKAWTKEYLLPLFSSSNDKKFQAVWEGLLKMTYHGYGGWNLTQGMAKLLYRPSYKAIKRISLDNNLGGLFVNFYTDMAMFAVKNPMKRWIPEFFKRSNRENRRKFTEALDWYIRSTDNKSNRIKWWDQWLESYWKNRLQGVPKPLDAVEMGHMLSWPLYFGPYMPEAVDLAIQMKPGLQDESVKTDVLFKLKNSEMWSHYPKTTSKLLLHLSKMPLGQGTLINLHSWGPEIIDNLLTRNLPDDLRRGLEDLRATLS